MHIYIYIYLYMYAYMYMCIHLYAYMYIHMYIPKPICREWMVTKFFLPRIISPPRDKYSPVCATLETWCAYTQYACVAPANLAAKMIGIHMCDATHLYVWHDPLHVYHITHLYVHRQWHCSNDDEWHSCVRNSPFMWVTCHIWIIRICTCQRIRHVCLNDMRWLRLVGSLKS